MSVTSATPEARKAKIQWLIGLSLLALLILLLWWFWPAKGNAPANNRWGMPGEAIPVRVSTVKQADFPVEFKALGTVAAYNTVNVRSRVQGELVKILFRDGQAVKAGDLLAVIDPRPYEVALQQALGTQQENRAQLKNAEIDLKRYRGLFAEDSIARQTLDTQEALVDQYRGTLKGNQAAVDEARLNLEFTQIRAPIDGRLGLRQLDVGNLVGASDTTPLVVITQTVPISTTFTLPEAELPAVLRQVRDGRELAVEAWDRGETLKLAEGRLESLDNLIDVATGTVKLKARFENAEQMLFPNQFVNVRLRVQTLPGALLVPSAAVQFGARGTFVYAVDADNKVHIRPVVLGRSSGEETVVEEGVAAGERLVVEGTDRLVEGSLIEVIDDPESPATAEQGVAPRDRDA